MNKQAITFLTLFILILMVSIYYVIIPVDDGSLKVSVKDVSTIESLESQKEADYQNDISQNNNTIASSKDTQEINGAIASNELIQNDIKEEKEMRSFLKEKGYKKVFVKITKENVKVVAIVEKNKKSIAADIISLLTKKYHERYTIDVKLIEE